MTAAVSRRLLTAVLRFLRRTAPRTWRASSRGWPWASSRPRARGTARSCPKSARRSPSCRTWRSCLSSPWWRNPNCTSRSDPRPYWRWEPTPFWSLEPRTCWRIEPWPCQIVTNLERTESENYWWRYSLPLRGFYFEVELHMWWWWLVRLPCNMTPVYELRCEVSEVLLVRVGGNWGVSLTAGGARVRTGDEPNQPPGADPAGQEGERARIHLAVWERHAQTQRVHYAGNQPIACRLNDPSPAGVQSQTGRVVKHTERLGARQLTSHSYTAWTADHKQVSTDKPTKHTQ